MEFKDTKTFKNLSDAFAGESMARNKYTYFASKAKKEGYTQIAEIFEETANNEKEHAKMWFKEMNDGVINDTYENLLEAAAGENGEWTDMYERMAQEANEEGYPALAAKFKMVGAIEKEHEQRYLKLAKNIKDKTVFTKSKQTAWFCRNCGHIHMGVAAPEMCPVCAHSKAYFEVKKENY